LYGNVAIDGANAYRIFFIFTGTVTLKNLILQNAYAKGGNSEYGGGGMGAGAGIFIYQADSSQPTSVTLDTVYFNNCSVQGGSPLDPGSSGLGGGGLGGDGAEAAGGIWIGASGAPMSIWGWLGGGGDMGPGSGVSTAVGYGLFGSGGISTLSGGNGGIAPGGSGSFGGGGGAGLYGSYGLDGYIGTAGGNGGFGGGGGMIGGNGGFGGGGGAGEFCGGNGGFGAGGGEGRNCWGAGGPYGGAGNLEDDLSFGGGGGALGPAIFIYQGTLTTINSGYGNMSAVGGSSWYVGTGDSTPVFQYSATVNGTSYSQNNPVYSEVNSALCPAGAASTTNSNYDQTAYVQTAYGYQSETTTVTPIPVTGYVLSLPPSLNNALTESVPATLSVTATGSSGSLSGYFVGVPGAITVTSSDNDPGVGGGVSGALTGVSGATGLSSCGVGVVTITLDGAANANTTPSSVSLTATGYTDATESSTVSGTLAGITVTPGAPVQFTVTGTTSVAPGAAFTVTATPQDNYGNPTTFSGTVTFTSTDSLASFSPSSTTVSNASSIATLATLETPGTQNITATGISGSTATTGKLSGITVSTLTAPAVAAGFSPSPVTIGGTSTLTVTVTNPNSAALGGVAFSNSYPSGLSGATATTTCPNTSLTSSSSGFSIAGIPLAASASCAVIVTITAPSSAGSLTDTPTAAISVQSGGNSGAVTGATLTVNQATPTVTVSMPSIAAYGGSYAPAILYNGDGTVSLSGTIGVCTATGSGTSYTVSYVGTGSCVLTIGASAGTNYAAVSNFTQSFTIGKAPLTVTASSTALSYGVAVPAITPSYSGWVGSDSSSVLTTTPTCTTTYTATSAAGSYPTSCFGAVAANYNISYIAGAVTVSQASTTITWATPAAITYGTGLSSAQLNAAAISNGSTITGTWSYEPAAGAILPAGTQTLTVIFTPSLGNYATATGSVSIQVNQATPTITWTTPVAITYGTALGVTQLDAVLSVAGNCTYSPVAGTVLSAGPHTLSATCTPTDGTDYATPSKATVSLTVNSAPLTVTASSAGVTYGATVPAITPSYSGWVTGDSSSVLTLAPTCTTTYTATSAAGSYPTSCSGAVAVNYNISYVAGTVTAGLASQTISFTAPTTSVTYGASSVSLTATASSGLTVSFTASGACAVSGSATLNYTSAGTCAVTASQAGNNDYSSATSASYTVTVNQAMPAITWATPAAITYGTVLSATQLNAALSVEGSCTYSPAAGTVLSVGSQALTATCTPNDTTDYTTATASVTLTVSAASIPTPTLSALSPAFTTADGAAFTLTLTGAGFVSSSTAYWGSTVLTTSYVSSTQVTATVPASLLNSPGIEPIVVENPSSSGGSNTMQFAIDSSSSGVTISTTTVTVNAGGTATYAVTAPSTATNLTAICLNLPAGASCAYSSSTGKVSITTSPVTPSGTYQVVIVFTETTTTTSKSSLILLPFLLLPFYFLRKKLRTRGEWLAGCLVLVVLAGTMTITGCGGGASTSTTTTSSQSTMSASVTLVVQ
jgi:hypothetical protein